MARARPASNDDADLLIVGGGMVGLSLALAAARAGLKVAVVDREAPKTLAAPTFDGRASSIALASAKVLHGIGLWPRVADTAQPILEIRVSDADSPLFLHYDHRAVGDAPLGYMVENRIIIGALHQLVAESAIDWRAPANAVRVTRGAAGVEAKLDDGARLRARVVAAADGKRSQLREAAAIPVIHRRYQQSAIVCTVTHARPHRGIAHERFLAAGPFAILPLSDDGATHRSSLVWTERADLAPALMALDEAGFLGELARRFGDFLGALAVVGPRWSYPLSLSHATRLTVPRLALVGDAGHAIHPIAGQGFNLGLRDVAALAEVLADARRLGLDIGGAEVLARYDRWRRFDSLSMTVVTDGLNRLFSNDIAPLRLVRDLGLAAVDRMAPLKSLFMRHAMGVLGDQPRLTRGEPI